MTRADEHLVIIDMQQKFMEGKNEQKIATALLTIQHLVTHCRSLAIPITFTLFPEKEFGHLLPELIAYEEEIVTKQGSDAFLSNAFRERVNKSEILHIAGCNLDVCVRLTVESGVNYGKHLVVYKNGILERSGKGNTNNLTWMQFFLNPSIQVRI